MVRQFLIIIRTYFSKDSKKFFTVSGILLALLLIVNICVDSFIPFQRWWMILRSFLAIPTTIVLFSLGYALFLMRQKSKFEQDRDWVPLRLQVSLSNRRRLAIVGAAFIIVFAYGTSKNHFYTSLSSVWLALVVALLAFIRPTKEEQFREELGIPDMRDIEVRRLQKEQKQRKKRQNNDD